MESIALLAVIGVLIVVGVSWVAPKIRVAAPIILVVVGIVLSFIPGTPDFEIQPEWILTVVLPPILYSAAVNVPITDFRRNLRAITGLSVGLVVISAFGTGLLLWWLLPDLSFAAAVALGAVISPPDAVAATSIGKRLGLPPRLVTVLEGEGLVNDATALVMLRSAIAATAGVVSFWEILGDFAFAVTVGIVIGAAVGLVTVWARSRINQPVLTTAISFVVPFLAFIPAEELHASGVLAVVVAGLVTGAKSAQHLSAQDRISERMNWRTAQLLLENGVFLVMGFSISSIITEVDREHLSVWGAVGIGLLASLALVIIRALFVIPLVISLRGEQREVIRKSARVDAALERFDAVAAANPQLLETRGPRSKSQSRFERARALLRRQRTDLDALRKDGLGWRGGAVLAWSGMRGVVTLAAAYTLPAGLPYRPQLILIAFTVAIATLVVQGGTLPALIRVLKIRGSDVEADKREMAQLIEQIVEAGRVRLTSPDLVQANGKPYDPQIISTLVERRTAVSNNLIDSFMMDPDSPLQQQAELFRLMLDSEQSELLDAKASGTYSSRALERAQIVIDTEIARTSSGGIG
ncbi:MAG: cation:proton antiporter [Rhodoglobus sp.]